jgi:hypothetical protein
MYKGYIAGLGFCTVRLMGLPVLFRRPNRGRRKIVVALCHSISSSLSHLILHPELLTWVPSNIHLSPFSLRIQPFRETQQVPYDPPRFGYGAFTSRSGILLCLFFQLQKCGDFLVRRGCWLLWKHISSLCAHFGIPTSSSSYSVNLLSIGTDNHLRVGKCGARGGARE